MRSKNLQAYWRTAKIFNDAGDKICRKDVRVGLCEQALEVRALLGVADDGEDGKQHGHARQDQQYDFLESGALFVHGVSPLSLPKSPFGHT